MAFNSHNHAHNATPTNTKELMYFRVIPKYFPRFSPQIDNSKNVIETTTQSVLQSIAVTRGGSRILVGKMI